MVRLWKSCSRITRTKAKTTQKKSCQQDSVSAGLKKIMSKMGISVLESYRGAQIFQCIGDWALLIPNSRMLWVTISLCRG